MLFFFKRIKETPSLEPHEGLIYWMFSGLSNIGVQAPLVKGFVTNIKELLVFIGIYL